MSHCFHEIIWQQKLFTTQMFLEQQICILELLKDHVTLKTGVMMLKI